MSAWKACDIRGPYPGEVNADLIRFAANAIASLLTAPARLMVAGDFRTSTPELRQAAAEGATLAGVEVLDAGQVPTPVAYFAHRRFGTEAVLIVTASHNPAGHNGLKFMIGHLPPSPEELVEIRNRQWHRGPKEGRIIRRDPIPDYLEWILDRWKHIRSGSLLSVVLDAGNGAWSELAPRVFEELGFRVHPLFCVIDGRFPNRIPDCARPDGLEAARRHVLSTGADLGVVWDGDGDRAAFVDAAGEAVTADEISLLLIRTLLRDKPGESVVYDLKMSDVVRRCIENMNARALVERSGHTFLKRRMILDNCIFGCEVSGHYFYRELYGGDDGLFTALLMADIIQRTGDLKSLRASLPRMFVTPDIRIPLGGRAFARIRDRVKSLFQHDEELSIDGLRLRTSDGFVLVRESVTEPVVTVRIEGFDQQSLDRLIDACAAAFPEAGELFPGKQKEEVKSRVRNQR